MVDGNAREYGNSSGAGQPSRGVAQAPGGLGGGGGTLALHAAIQRSESAQVAWQVRAAQRTKGGGRGLSGSGATPGGLDARYHTGIVTFKGAVMATRKTIADKLIKLAEGHFDFYIDDVRQDVVAVPRGGPRLGMSLRGGRGSVSSWLIDEFNKQHGGAATPHAVRSVLALFEARAEETITTYLRCARTDEDRLTIDLGTPSGACIEVRNGRWFVRPKAAVLFRRTAATSAMVRPKRGGDLNALRDIFLLDKEVWELVRAWLVLAWLEDIPVPILGLLGPYGSGKTFLGKACVRLVDPNPAPLQRLSKKEGDWEVTMNSSRVIGLDNVSRLSQDKSDDIARGVTGDGSTKRALFTDSDLVIYSYRRAFVLTSIDPGAMQGDFADRLMAVVMQRIEKRMTERAINAATTRLLPQLFGGLLGMVARVLNDPIELDDLPRMADAACVIGALDAASGGTALSGYQRAHTQAAQRVLEGDPLTSKLLDFMRARQARDNENNGHWQGTPTKLYEELSVRHDYLDPQWPANAQKMSGRLERASEALRTAGLGFGRTRGNERELTVWWL